MILKIFRDQAMVLSNMDHVVESIHQNTETTQQQSSSMVEIATEPSKVLRTLTVPPVESQKGARTLKAIHQMPHLGIKAKIGEFEEMLNEANALRVSV